MYTCRHAKPVRGVSALWNHVQPRQHQVVLSSMGNRYSSSTAQSDTKKKVKVNFKEVMRQSLEAEAKKNQRAPQIVPAHRDQFTSGYYFTHTRLHIFQGGIIFYLRAHRRVESVVGGVVEISGAPKAHLG